MERHIVVAGHGRSGSTMFYNMLRNTLVDFTIVDRELRASACLDQPGNFCTKRPLDIYEIDTILDANSRSKRIDLIVTIRDPRDILTSRHPSVPDCYFTDANQGMFLEAGRPNRYGFWGFIQTQLEIERTLEAGKFAQGVFILKYEHLVEDPERVQNILARELGLTFDGSFCDFHKGRIPEGLSTPLNGIREVDRSRVAKWRSPEHLERIYHQFRRFPMLHDYVISLGYEQDRSWFDEIVEARLRSGVQAF